MRKKVKLEISMIEEKDLKIILYICIEKIKGREDVRAKGWKKYGLDSKLKLEDQLKNLRTI